MRTEQRYPTYAATSAANGPASRHTTAYMPMGDEKRRPEQTFRAGGISVSVWKNTTKEGDKEYRTVTFERSYKDPEGNWKTSNSLRVNDLPKAAVVLAKAYEYLVLKGHEAGILDEAVA